MTPERLTEVRERVAKATAGPWWNGHELVLRTVEGMNRTIADCLSSQRSMEDAAFIAHARQDVPDLLAEVARLAMEVRHLQELSAAHQALIGDLLGATVEVARLRAALEAAKMP